MATYSSMLALEIPWTEEFGRLLSMGSQKSRIWLSTHTYLKLLNIHARMSDGNTERWKKCIGRHTNESLWRAQAVWRFLKKLKIELPCDTAIPLLDIFSEKTTIQKETCSPMFIAPPFPITRTRTQSQCPSTEDWIEKMWCIYTTEYYSAMKKNGTGSFVEMWMDLETVIQSELSQKEKKLHINTYVEYEKLVKMFLFTK